MGNDDLENYTWEEILWAAIIKCWWIWFILLAILFGACLMSSGTW
jgi:hypothetical protein